ncbi:hypothetical protein SELMODRAFT_420677 [Selaginella moellendorffii]|uniref:Uncharacterized protein n=1 Tax=Selaginella moellendorffii TaxID=88036 RepID=D8SCS0_SELML|nr:hypothetical protein SELMODRAFT_420677 [Selaginella moellendorffii]
MYWHKCCTKAIQDKDELIDNPLPSDEENEETNEKINIANLILQIEVYKRKLNQGLSMIDNLVLLKSKDELSQDEIKQAFALGWCIEWVGIIAVNNALLLINHVPKILRKYFHSQWYYFDLHELFDEDCEVQDSVLFFLSSDKSDNSKFESVKKILLQLGTYFKIQVCYVTPDDGLCYVTPDVKQAMDSKSLAKAFFHVYSIFSTNIKQGVYGRIAYVWKNFGIDYVSQAQWLGLDTPN